MENYYTLSVPTPESAAKAKVAVGPVAQALSLAHAEAVKRAIHAQTVATRILAWADAQKILEAQVNLVAIELFLVEQERRDEEPTFESEGT